MYLAAARAPIVATFSFACSMEAGAGISTGLEIWRVVTGPNLNITAVRNSSGSYSLLHGDTGGRLRFWTNLDDDLLDSRTVQA
jgi:hypothetical protein